MNILLSGASGRLGKEISTAAHERQWTVVPLNREQVKTLNATAGSTIQANSGRAILIDVSLPEGTETIVDQLIAGNACDKLAALIIGTTGHSPTLTKKLETLAQRVPVVVSSNFSRGIYFFEELLQAKTSSGVSVAELAKHLGFDLALWESHHTLKKDAPSGTAKTLANAAGVQHDRIASTRVGSVVGEHTLFVNQGAEEIRITHVAHARRLFADGAIDLCERISKTTLEKRLYTMSQALNNLLREQH